MGDDEDGDHVIDGDDDADEKDDDGVTHLNGGIPPEKVQWGGASGHKH